MADSQNHVGLIPLRRFRLLSVRWGLSASVLAAAVAFPISLVAAKGILAGGMAGVLAFWLTAYRMEKVASRGGDALRSLAGYTVVRLSIYAAVLYWAYALNKESPVGLLSAAGGLYIIRLVQIILGLTGWDQKAEADGDHRG